MQEWVRILGPILISWPVAVMVVVITLRLQLKLLAREFVKRSGGRIDLGPIKIELGEIVESSRDAVSRLHRLSLVMAEGRIVELEITAANLGRFFTETQKQRIEKNISDLKDLMNEIGVKGGAA